MRLVTSPSKIFGSASRKSTLLSSPQRSKPLLPFAPLVARGRLVSACFSISASMFEFADVHAASQRQHLRDVIRLGANGTVFHLGLTPLQAVMGTDKKIVAAMLNEDAFKDVGIIRQWQQLSGRT